MTTYEIIIAILIHLIIPLTGLIIYLRLAKRISKEKIANPPTTELFFIFATYGGLLIVILTTLLWKWSGLASLGTFYLILGAPIIMGIISYHVYYKQDLSKYHLWTYKSSIYYFLIGPLGLLLCYFLDPNKTN